MSYVDTPNKMVMILDPLLKKIIKIKKSPLNNPLPKRKKTNKCDEIVSTAIWILSLTLSSACYFQTDGMLPPPQTPCNVFTHFQPPHPPTPLLSRPSLVLVVRHARGIPCHSCHVKECSQKTKDVFGFFCFVFFCSKHLNMHHSLPLLNHVVGSETHAHLTRTCTNRRLLYIRACTNWETRAQWLGASSWLAGR